jgi:hypothetical protein
MTRIRVVARFYLLRPDSELQRAVAYTLAHYAAKHGIVLHAACLMSTHLHLIYSDIQGSAPEFRRDAHRIIANLTKAIRGWRGPVFSGAPNVVRLLTPEAVIDKLGYVMANPVAAAAVRYAKDWPGLNTRANEVGAGGRTISRPTRYFDQAGKMPPAVVLRFELPDCVRRAYGVEGGLKRIREAVKLHEGRGRAEVEKRGWRFLGADRCLKVSPYRRAKAYEVFGAREPTFATLGGGRAAFNRAVDDLRNFRAQYRDARLRFGNGERHVLFPFGTWMMRVLHGVRCATGPPTSFLAA